MFLLLNIEKISFLSKYENLSLNFPLDHGPLD